MHVFYALGTIIFFDRLTEDFQKCVVCNNVYLYQAKILRILNTCKVVRIYADIFYQCKSQGYSILFLKYLHSNCLSFPPYDENIWIHSLPINVSEYVTDMHWVSTEPWSFSVSLSAKRLPFASSILYADLLQRDCCCCDWLCKPHSCDLWLLDTTSGHP